MHRAVVRRPPLRLFLDGEGIGEIRADRRVSLPLPDTWQRGQGRPQPFGVPRREHDGCATFRERDGGGETDTLGASADQGGSVG